MCNKAVWQWFEFSPVSSDSRFSVSCRDKHQTVSSSLFQRLCCCWPLLCSLCVCVFDHCHYQLLASGWETATRRPLSLSFHISISFFVLWCPRVAVCCTVPLKEHGHTLVAPSISSFSFTPAGFRAFYQSDERLVCPLADIKKVRARKDKIR